MEQTKIPLTTRARTWVLLLALLVLTFVVFADSLGAPGLPWDDEQNIFTNPYYLAGLWWHSWTEAYYGLYVPVTSSVWAILYRLSDGAPEAFRAFNLVIHLCNITLLFFLLRGLARRLSIESSILVVSAVGLFSVHPMQVQAVAWISGGRDLLAAFLTMSSILIYFRFSNRAGYFGATALFALAILSKPNVVVLPVVVMAIESLIYGRTWKLGLFKMLPWFAMSLAGIAVTQIGQGPHFENLVSWWQRPFLMMDSYWFYIHKTLWPSALSANYAHKPQIVMTHEWWWLSGVLSFSGLALTLWFMRRKPAVLALAFAWFIFLFPVSGIVPFAYQNIGGVADHYNYLSLACLSGLLMLSLAQFKTSVILFIPVIGIFGMSYRSWERTAIWQSNGNFYLDMVKSAPEEFNTSIGMSILMCKEVKDYKAGLMWTDKALKASPNDIMALANRAFCFTEGGYIKEIIEMADLLSGFDHEVLIAKSPTAYSSFLTSLGRAFILERQYERGFQMICEGYRVLPSNKDYEANLDKVMAILKSHNLSADCLSLPRVTK